MKSPVRSLHTLKAPLGKIVLRSAALAAGGLLLGGTAWGQAFDTSGATVTCTTIVASASLKPPISASSTGSGVTKVKATLDGCIVTGATPSNPTIIKGTLKGTLNTTGSPGCGGLLGGATIAGDIIVKWKAASGQTLDFPTTTVSGGSITGGTFAPGTASVGGSGFQGVYGKFTISGQTIQPNSAFAGATPSATAATQSDVGVLNNLCNGTGIKKITLGLGNFVL